MGTPDYVLSRYEFDVLWAQLCPGPMPHPFSGRRVPHTVFTDEVYRELTVRGLVAADRQVDAGLAGLLRLLERHRVAVDLVGDVGYPVRALAATDGRVAVLAALAGEELWLTGIRPADLVPAIVGLVPAAPRASSANMDGRFGITTGDRRQAPEPVAWFDTSEGRYLAVHEESRLCVEPADHAGIERRVAAALSSVDRPLTLSEAAVERS